MARLASLAQAKDFIAGGQEITGEKQKALELILDSVSRQIETFILGDSQLSLKQAEATEKYGVEHYGRRARNTIRLRRYPVASIASVVDDGTTVDASNYDVAASAGVLYLVSGKFSEKLRAVAVTYTAGYAEIGADGSLVLDVPADLNGATLQQVAHEWSARQPGGAVYGATSVVHRDGSMFFESKRDFLPSVLAVLRRYRRF